MDLERSGISVILIDDFSTIDEILLELNRRAVPPNLFVAGSGLSPDELDLVERLGYELGIASDAWNIVSLGSQPARRMAIGLKHAMRERGNYQPERARFYYREAPSESRPVPRPEERVGTVVYTEQSVERMRDAIIHQSQVLALFGGGQRTPEEVRTALEAGLLVIPFGETAQGIVRAVRAERSGSGLLANKLQLGVRKFEAGSFDLRRTAQRLASFMTF